MKNSTLNSVSTSNLTNSANKITPDNSVMKELKNIEDDLIGNKNDEFAKNIQKFK